VRDTPSTPGDTEGDMETMHAAGRRTLPPVPRSGRGRDGARKAPEVRAPVPAPTPAAAPAESPAAEPDDAQQFVTCLRGAAVDFAVAAGAESAVVREVVPPARHRRARCRVVLRFADDTEADVTFLGQAGEPGVPSRHGFDRQIRRWLGSGQVREDAWLVPDPDAPDGLAVDLSAWRAAG
jgi:hypothetical protein